MALNTRKATGVTPYPLILVEGVAQSDRRYLAAELTASSKVGACYWLDIGEGAADVYASIPGAAYEVIVHNGTWAQIFDQVEEVNKVAEEAHRAGDKPVVLIVDSMSGEWDLLKEWVSSRARNAMRMKLANDPDAEIRAGRNHWDDANARHTALMQILMKFPGIVVMIARAHESNVVDDKGNTITDADYRIDGQKSLAFDASAWVRTSRSAPPTIIGAQSAHWGYRPWAKDAPATSDFTLEKLIFDWMRCGNEPRALIVKPGFAQMVLASRNARDRDEIQAIWSLARDADYLDAVADADGKTIRSLLLERHDALKDNPAAGELS